MLTTKSKYKYLIISTEIVLKKQYSIEPTIIKEYPVKNSKTSVENKNLDFFHNYSILPLSCSYEFKFH